METLQLKKFVKESYGLNVKSLKKLNGYDNENYLLTSKEGKKFVLKKYPFTKKNISLISAENDCLIHLNKNSNSSYPTPVLSCDDEYLEIIYSKKDKYIIRVLSYLKGKFLGEIQVNDNMLNSLGELVGNLNKHLKNYSNDSISSRKWEWDIQYLNLNKKFLKYIEDPNEKKIVLYFFQQFEENVLPILDQLRTSIIHNDTNEWNILKSKNGKLAIIDFGDLTNSQLINEIAIAMTYASYDKKNPLDSASIVLNAYNKIIKLTDQEISIIYYLMAAKLCISVCNSAYSKKVNPKNTYALVSEKNAWSMLKYLIKTSPIHAENIFRKALNRKINKLKSVKTYIKERHSVISPIFSLSYKKPIAFDRAAFQYMFDKDGNTFLDAYNNIPIVGHSHPKVTSAISKQITKLNTNTRYIYDQLYDYGSRLIKKFPKKLSKIYFVNSGSEASDLAIKIALSHSKNNNITVVENGYHGHTQRGTDISHYKFNNKKGQGIKDYIIKVPMPNTYNSIYSVPKNKIGKKYAEDAINKLDDVAAFISEPILGCGGQVPLAEGYLKEMYREVRKRGGVCISDEVQTGFGRLGEYFWGFEMHRVIPDIVILGKPMGNGHPIGAVITTDKIAESFGKGVEFFSSFGGNPVSCAAGLAVLDVIEEEKLQENAKRVGNYYMRKLNELKKEFKNIGDIRGSGLFIGIEITKENSKKPNTELAQKIKNELRKKQILVGSDGPQDNVIKSKPPICFSKENVNEVIDSLKSILQKNCH
jgi:4-aminobutyrate aminotransferase-like enzyme/Ser/Thr protein kinase RdoA (MazF antagonist)